MPTGVIVLLVVIAVLAAILIVLYFLGRKAEKRQAEQDAQIKAAAQSVTLLIIDKKKVRMKDSGLPESMINQTPWYGKMAKIPVVKAKVGPQVRTFVCDAAIYDLVPLKKEVKAQVSGLYISSVKGMRGQRLESTKKRRGMRAWAAQKLKEQREASGK